MVSDRRIVIAQMYSVAVDLLSENGENPEYDRALSELIAEFDYVVDMPLDTRAAEVLVELRRERKERGW